VRVGTTTASPKAEARLFLSVNVDAAPPVQAAFKKSLRVHFEFVFT
jgi:hypothetical protein